MLAAQDLKKIKQTLLTVKINNPVEELHKSLKHYKRILHAYGINLAGVRFFVVDSYPHPYDKHDSLALNCDIDDKEEFDITPGVYFKKTKIVPFLSCEVLAHELVHVCLSEVCTKRLARGLEDGLCDLVGLYLSSKVLGFDIAKNILINLRFAHPFTRMRRIYAETLRQAIRIYQIYGLKGTFEVLERGNREGRTVVKQIEEKCIRGEYSDLGLEKGDWAAELDYFSNCFVGFPSSIVASPLACYLAEKIKAGSLIKDVIKKHGISPREGCCAVKQLEKDLYLIVTSNGRIVYDETKTYVKTGTLRYAIKPV